MKLTKFKEKNHKKIGIILFTICCVLLVTVVFLYKSFAIFETNENKNIIRGNVEDMGDLYFSFYLDNDIQRKMPTKGSGVVFDKEKSYCEVHSQKDPSITLDFDLETWSVITSGLKDNHTKCNLYFKKTYNDTTLFDLSGNNYNGTFHGAKVQKDEEDNLGIYFDGVDNYVDIEDLPETIDWASGFTIEFEAMWKEFLHYSRIFDFGNGSDSDNIFVSNYMTDASLSLGSRYGKVNEENYRTFSTVAVPEVSIDKDKKNYYKLIVRKEENNIIIDIYKELTLSGAITYDVTKTGNILKNILRTENYLGKSNWSKDGYFNGYIYSLKITDSKNNIILWYDF